MAQLKELETVAQWEEELDNSGSQPLFVFKHSTQCPISGAAFDEFQNYLNGQAKQDVSYVLVKVIESREVSNKIADDLGIKHESPQAIVVKGREGIWNKSHRDITENSISDALN